MRTGSPSLFPSASPCEGDLFSTFAIVLVVVVLFVSNWDNSYYSIQTAVGKLSQFIDCLVLPWLTCVIKYSNRGGSIGILNSLYPQDKHTCVSIKNKIRKKKKKRQEKGGRPTDECKTKCQPRHKEPMKWKLLLESAYNMIQEISEWTGTFEI